MGNHNSDDILRRATGVPWKKLSEDQLASAESFPAGESMIAPRAESGADTVLPEDIRAEIREGAGDGRMISRSLGGGNVTLMVTPPDEQGLTSIQGRLWLPDPMPAAIRVVLSQEDHVLTVQELATDRTFQFEELIRGEWDLEFHVGPEDMLVLRGQSA